MNSKYLPIGSVCTLKGRDGKFMIIGLYSTVYNNGITVYDYKACTYPYGTTLQDQFISFNHDDIENVDFKGYMNEDADKLFMVLQNKLSGTLFHEVSLEQEVPSFSNIEFDENGYVVKAESSTPSSNPFVNNVEIEKPQTATSIFQNIRFDENGTVISADKVDENGDVESQNLESETSNAMATNNVEENQVATANQSAEEEYEFDENGTVIAVKTKDAPTDANNLDSEEYQFDENGVVIAVNGKIDSKDNDSNDTTDNSSESPVGDIEYEFDENGVIIGIKS